MIHAWNAHPGTGTRTKMKDKVSNELDGPERADLLCFLVLAQLIGHATTGDVAEGTGAVPPKPPPGCDAANGTGTATLKLT